MNHGHRSHPWLIQASLSLTLIARCALVCAQQPTGAIPGDDRASAHAGKDATFQTSDRCLACHNGLRSERGEDVSIGIDWRTSLMANSARDPYWQASVRRETQEHAAAVGFIQDDCSVCHMPIARYLSKQAGRQVELFGRLPMRAGADRQASDGVSCSVCHQIRPDNLGTEESFNGQFVVHGAGNGEVHPEFGPFEIDAGLMQVMRSSSDGYQPQRGDHIRSAELCATCHTLKTNALGPDGSVIGTLPEQMPYQEWLHSDYRQRRSCQSCHMPQVQGPAPVAAVLGEHREGMARHEFVAADFIMQRIFSHHAQELGAVAPAEEYAAAADRTERYLHTAAARIGIDSPQVADGWLHGEIQIENLGGHKLPTAFPSRRAWLHVVVRDGGGRQLFESGAERPDGSIVGNVNDDDPARYAPHLREIRAPTDVQIYESILGDARGSVTTGLLSAVGYLKDNRLLPHGFDKSTADPQIAVHGVALTDPGFTDRGDRVRLSVDVHGAAGPFSVEVELRYQPIGYRWAQNLRPFRSPETERFNGFFAAEAQRSATTLARAVARTD